MTAQIIVPPIAEVLPDTSPVEISLNPQADKAYNAWITAQVVAALADAESVEVVYPSGRTDTLAYDSDGNLVAVAL